MATFQKSELGPESETLRMAMNLSIKMSSLGLRASFERVIEGPVISQYVFRPSLDAQLGKILSKTEDLALSVGAESLIIRRIKNEIYIDIPNQNRKTINFDTCLQRLQEDSKFGNSSNYLPLLMGQTSEGKILVKDLIQQPHILIAGSTGAGKSIFQAQLISTLALVKEPSELRLILVDTKQLDLVLFNTLPHVDKLVTKAEDLTEVLEILLNQVRHRTETISGLARNMQEFNALYPEEAFPYIVLVIDELADVLDSNKTIAPLLKQLAQISRAAGIHIIAATQRPSAKILSGDTKANFPTRISFKLPASQDSRVILGENGAESLLGKGDYLYCTTEMSQPERAHSAFIQMSDIARILEQHEYIRASFKYKL